MELMDNQELWRAKYLALRKAVLECWALIQSEADDGDESAQRLIDVYDTEGEG